MERVAVTVEARVHARQRSSVRALAQWAPMEAQSCRAQWLERLSYCGNEQAAGTALTTLVVALVTANGGRGR